MRLLGLIYKKGTLVDSPDSRFNWIKNIIDLKNVFNRDKL
jgi:hypothetical protein